LTAKNGRMHIEHKNFYVNKDLKLRKGTVAGSANMATKLRVPGGGGEFID
jgi:hypothetical protein